MQERGVVLLSGGIDSTTCLGIAIDTLGRDNVSTLAINYGQKHNKELIQSKLVSEYYDVPHYELDLSEIFKECTCSLMASSKEPISKSSYSDQIQESKIVPTYVPFRNGLMLSAAASYSWTLYPDAAMIYLYLGAHADDTAIAAYADCTPEFYQSIKQAVSSGTYGKVIVEMPLIDINKTDVVRIGTELGVPYHLTWSCYDGGDKPCGRCATCLDRAKAFKDAGISDPAL